MSEILLMIGTKKGVFLAHSDEGRSHWRLEGPVLAGAQVNHVTLLEKPRPRLLAAAKSEWWGPTLRVSEDLGRTWHETAEGLRFEPDRERSVDRIWTVVVGLAPGGGHRLYAGVDPGALFVSDDGGATWVENRALSDHPTRSRWQPGAGGLMVHSICPDPVESQRLLVGISAAGVFRTEDGGRTWTACNRGVRTDFLAEKFPEVGQCVHHMEMHPTTPAILYQQNHCGVYRTENGGDDWVDISDGLPSRFGFPLAVHPHDGDTIYVVPQESDAHRVTPGGAFRVYRSRDRGASWEALTQGLPQTNAYCSVLRQAAATDALDPVGVYVGTQAGQIVASRDEGNSWELLFNWLPPVYSLAVRRIA